MKRGHKLRYGLFETWVRLCDMHKKAGGPQDWFWQPSPAEIEISRQRIKESLARMEERALNKEIKRIHNALLKAPPRRKL